MKIKIYTNRVEGGWKPQQVKNGGVGGSEEMLVMWAEYMAKDGNKVEVYMNGFVGGYGNVEYFAHDQFNRFERCDLFISFKAKNILEGSINAEKIIHWSHESESLAFVANNLDCIVCLTEYHAGIIKSALDKKHHKKIRVIGNFIDPDEFKVSRDIKEYYALYCSSPDRGLSDLLVDFDLIDSKFNFAKLFITYGFDQYLKIQKNNSRAQQFVKDCMSIINENPKIEYLGQVNRKEMNKLYEKCMFWFLPLISPESELFCINAVKAQENLMIPIVNKIGGLQNTVNECVNYGFVKTDGAVDVLRKVNFEGLTEKNRKINKKFYISNVMEKWQKLIK